MATSHQTSSQTLECPMCLTFLNQPKSLACSHSFCRDCLQRVLQTDPNQETITCPVCRKKTPVPSGDVGELQTNILLISLMDKAKIRRSTCTICDPDEKPPAVSYCRDCKEIMCDSCQNTHSTWKPLSNHSVVSIEEVLSVKVPLKRQRNCKKHANQDQKFFCAACREYVCNECAVSEHSKKRHRLVATSEHEEQLMKNVKELKGRAIAKKTILEKHIKFTETKHSEMTSMMTKLNDDIDKTYEECVEELSDKREALKCKVKQRFEEFKKKICDMAEESRVTINHINTMEELLTKDMMVQLEKDALFAHDTLCENLKSILGRGDPDNRSPRRVAEQARKITFRRCVGFHEFRLGELRGYVHKVILNTEVDLPVGFTTSCIARAPDGKMALGSSQGGICIFSTGGDLQETVLNDVPITAIAFLSYGRSVVSDDNRKLSLYTPQWEKLNVQFLNDTGDTHERSIWLSVDGNDYIYVAVTYLTKIQVFTPHGGKAVREIECHEFCKKEIFSFQSGGNLILKKI